jgi:hypothetical protein
MPSVKTVERQIGNLEGFDVRFLHGDGRDVRSDLGGVPSYSASFERAAKDSMTVSDWKTGRFRAAYAGYDCEVLDASGKPVHGASLLSSVRATYRE